MSATVDSRVLEMRFDNSQFESGVKTSMSTLERLKQALHLKGASDGLNNVSAAAKKCNLSPLSQGIESVKVKFSALQVAGVTALANITNSAVNAGKNLVNAFAFEPVLTGFKEYETQIGAVQTILANTQHQGTNLEQVNAALDELNRYADKTIYNFTEMTRNIGTFTAAGVDLDTSVNSIKGIANLAAISGSTSQQASTAMYQLSQALAAGKVQLADWNSVVNAGMGGKVFQDALIRTSEILGTGAKAAIEANGSFRESLTSTGWLTKEVLNETLNQFAGAYTEADLIQQGYSESQAKEIAKMAINAEEAATKVKTFTQLLDTLKEAAQSGWTESWETIVGDFEEAKSLWTKVSDTLGGMIGKSAENRNAILSGAFDSKWDSLIDKVKEAGVSTDEFQEKVKEAAREHGVNIDQMITEQGSLRDVIASGSLSSDVFVDALKKVAGTETQISGSTEDLNGKLAKFQEVVDQVWHGDFKNGAERVKALTDAGYEYAEVQDLVNKTVDGHRLTLEDLSDAQLESVGYTEEQISKIHELAKQAEETGTPINDLIKQLERPSGRWLMIDSVKNAFTSITTALSSIKQAWREAFWGDASDEDILKQKSERLYNMIDGIHNFSKALVVLSEGSADKLKRTFRGIFSAFSLVSTFAGGALTIGFRALTAILSGMNLHILDITAGIGDAITRFKEWAFENNVIMQTLTNVGSKMKDGALAVRDWFAAFAQMPQVQKAFENVGGVFGSIFEGIKAQINSVIETVKSYLEALRNAKSLSDIGNVFSVILQSLKDFAGGFSITGTFNSAIESFRNFRTAVSESLRSAGIDLEALKATVGQVCGFIASHIGALVALFAGVVVIRAIDKIGDALKVLAAPLENLGNILNSISDAIDNFGEGLTKYFKAKAFEAKSVGIRNLASSVAILAGALAIVTRLDQKNLWSSVGALAALTVSLGLMSVVLGKLGSFKGVAGMSSSLLLMAGALFMLAECITVITSITPGDISKGMLVMAGITAMLTGLMAATRLATGGHIKGIGPAIMQLSLSMMILVGLIKMVSGISAGEIAKGLVTIAGIEALISGLALSTRLVGKNDFKRLGSTVMNLSFAMMNFVFLIRMISGISPENLAKGIATMAALDVIIAGLAAVSRLSGKNATRAGAMILQISLALMALAGVIRIIDGINPAALTKGITVIAVLEALAASLVAVSKLAGKNAAKAGLMIIEISGAMLILVGLIAIIQGLDVAALAKGLVVIGLLSAIISGLMIASHFAGKAKGTLIGLTIAISALTALIAALSFIDPSQAIPAATALGIVITAFGALVAATGQIKTTHLIKTIAMLALLTGIVTGIGAIVSTMSSIGDVGSTLALAGSMSMLITALSAASVILSKSSGVTLNALGAVTALGAIVSALGGLITLMTTFGNTDGAVKMASAMSMLAVSLSAACVALGLCKPIGKDALAALGVMSTIVGVLGGIIAALGAYDLSISIESVAALSILAVSLSAACLLLSKAGPAATAALPAVIGLTKVLGIISGVILAVGAIGAGIERLAPGALDALTSALGKIGNALGSFFGGIAHGFNVQATKDLDSVGQNLADFVNSFTNISPEAIDGAKSLAETLGILAGANLFNKLSDKFGGGGNSIASMSAQLPTLGEGLSEFSNSISGLTKGGIEKIKMAGEAAKAVAEFAAAIPNQGGKLAFLVGDNMIGSWGPQLPAFGKYLSEFSDSVAGVNADAITNAAKAATALTDFADAIPNEGGALATIVGDNTIGSWAPQLAELGMALSNFSSTVGGVDAGAIRRAADAAEAVADFARAIPNEGGIAAAFAGENSIGVWGPELTAFGLSLVDFSNSVTGINISAINEAATAASSLAAFADAIPDQKGLVTKFVGDNRASVFGDELVSFGHSLSEFSQAIGDIDISAINMAVDAANGLTELANALPESGGFVSIFTADNDFSTFGKELEKFGESLSRFSASIVGANIDQMVGAADSVATLVSAFSRMGNLDTSSITSFKQTLQSLGEIDFSANLKSLSEIDAAQLEGFGELITTLGEMSRIGSNSVSELKQTLQELTSIDFSAFKFDTASADAMIEQLTAFSTKLKEYCASIADIDFTAVNIAAGSLERLRDLVQGLSGLDITSVSAFTTAVELLSGIEIGGIFSSGSDINVDNISALGRLSAIISSLAGIDTTGVGVYITAVELLSGMTVSGVLTDVAINVGNLTGLNMLTSTIRGMVGLDSSGVTAFTTGMKALSEVEPTGILGEGFALDQTKVSCLNGLTSAIAGMVGIDTTGVDAFKQAMESLSEVTIGGILLSGFAVDTNLASKITSLVGAINSTASINTAGVDAFVAAMETLGSIDLGGFFERLNGASNEAVNAGVNIITGIAVGINQANAELTSAMKNAIQTVARSATDQGSIFEAAGQDLMSRFASGLNRGTSQVGTGVITTATEPLISAINAEASKFQSAGQSLMDNFSKGLSSGGAKVPSSANQVVSAAISMINTKAGQFQVAGQNLLSKLASGIRSGGSKINSAVNTVLTSAINAISSKAGAFQTKGLVLISKTAEGIRSGASLVNSATISAVSSAASALSSYYSQFYNAGAYLMQGFAAGIDSAGAAAVAKAKSYAQQAASAVKSALDIHSPSKVMYKLGEFAVLGFANAFRDGNATAAEVGTGLAMSAAAGLGVASKVITDQHIKANEEQLSIEDEYWQALLRKRQEGIDGERYQDMSLVDFKEEVTNRSIELLDNYSQALDTNTQALLDNSNMFKEQATTSFDSTLFKGVDSLKENSKWLDQEGMSRNTSELFEAAKDTSKLFEVLEDKSTVFEVAEDKSEKAAESTKKSAKKTKKAAEEVEKVLTPDMFMENLQKQTTSLQEYDSVMDSLGTKLGGRKLEKYTEGLGADKLDDLKVLNNLTEDQIKKSEELIAKQEEANSNAFIRNFESQTTTLQEFEGTLASVTEKYKDSPLKDLVSSMGVDDLDNLKVLNNLTADQVAKAEELMLLQRTYDAETFIRNLGKQTESLETYDATLAAVTEKYKDSPLMTIIDDMGVDDLDNLKMLNGLTAEQVTQAEALLNMQQSSDSKAFLRNLQDQASNLQEYGEIITELGVKLKDSPLKDLISQMGVDQLDSLRIINSLTADELHKAEELILEKREADIGVFLQNIKDKTNAINEYETVYDGLMKKLEKSPLIDIVSGMGVDDLENLKLIASMSTEELKAAEEAYTALTVAQAGFAERNALSSQTVLANLEADNEQLTEYRDVYDELLQKVQGTPLGDVIADMGLKDLEQLKIINGMTEEELAYANDLLTQKQLTAEEIAKLQNSELYEQDMVSKAIELTKEYTDSLEENTQAIFERNGLFDKPELSWKSGSWDKSAKNIIGNLREQQNQIEVYNSLMDSVPKRAALVGTKLADEIATWTVDQVDELAALNGASEEQLQQIVKMYDEKFALAQEAGVKQTAGVKEEVEKLLSDLFGGVEVELGEFVEMFDGSFDSIERYISDKREDFVNSGKKIASSVSKGINQGLPAVVSAAQAMINKVKQIVENGVASVNTSIGSGGKQATTSAKKAGSNVSDGLSKGMESGKPNVAKTALGLAGAAVAAVTGALAIHSPSKVFYDLGEYSSKGFVNAFYDYESRAHDAGADIADSTMSGLRDALSRIQKVVNSDIETQPTIRPVIDLSDVTNGVGQIDSMFGFTPSVGLLSKVGSISARMNTIQNGANADIIDAIHHLGMSLGGRSGDTYNVNGITYDDGSNIASAVQTLVRAARVERRR